MIEGVRLQKVLASAGVGSRRKCEQLMVEGRVEVDGEIIRELGSRIDPENAIVRVDGAQINLRAELVYLALNKPPGVLSAMSDPEGRPTVADYIAERPERLFHVGRLDIETEGLLLLTNDGALAHRLTHPSFGIEKTYLAEVPGPVPRNLGGKLRGGVMLEDGLAKVDRFQLVESGSGKALVELTLHEGRNHIVRRLLDAVGHPVRQLVRTAVGPVQLGHLRSGTVRRLSPAELAGLYKLADLSTADDD
jgi:23S rRNA pseudouridine2605 synthase